MIWRGLISVKKWRHSKLNGVEVACKHSGSGALQVREDESQDLPRGTRITLHLKEDAAELADAAKLGSLIKQYSEFIQFPIKLWSSKTEYEQVCTNLCLSCGRLALLCQGLQFIRSAAFLVSLPQLKAHCR